MSHRMRAVILVLGLGAALVSGARYVYERVPVPAVRRVAFSPGSRDVSPMAERVRKRWLKEHSYYAFLEIIDARLDPIERPGATVLDVERELGPPTCAGPDCYPNFTERDWFYETERQILVSNKAILSFDENWTLKSIDWVSE